MISDLSFYFNFLPPSGDISDSQYLVKIVLFILHNIPSRSKITKIHEMKKVLINCHLATLLCKQIENYPWQASPPPRLNISISSQSVHSAVDIKLKPFHFAVSDSLNFVNCKKCSVKVWNIKVIDDPELNCLKIMICSAEDTSIELT